MREDRYRMKDILLPLRRLHGYMHEANLKRIRRKTLRGQVRGQANKVFLVLTPAHGNIGDHGIANAETKFLRDAGIDYFEITGAELQQMQYRNELSFLNGYNIVVNGGGYLGTIWPDGEKLLRSLVCANPKSIIVCLPNTIYYENSERAKAEFEESRRIYNSHKHLYLYAREERSFEVMSKAYRNVKLVPDMVLYLNKCRNDRERHGCILCLRSDREKTRTQEQEDKIVEQAHSLFGDDIITTDMVEPCRVSPAEREDALERKFSQFSGAKLVITDRLHGMIFCAITGTPCVVVDSKSPKVRGCYEWIKHLDYIRFADDASKIAEEYRRIPECEHHYDNSHLMHYYDELADDIKTIILRKKKICR